MRRGDGAAQESGLKSKRTGEKPPDKQQTPVKRGSLLFFKSQKGLTVF